MHGLGGEPGLRAAESILEKLILVAVRHDEVFLDGAHVARRLVEEDRLIDLLLFIKQKVVVCQPTVRICSDLGCIRGRPDRIARELEADRARIQALQLRSFAGGLVADGPSALLDQHLQLLDV